MNLLLIFSILFLIVVGFFNFMYTSWYFFIGIALIITLTLLFRTLGLKKEKTFKLLLVSIIILNFIPFPRNGDSEFGPFLTFYGPPAWGLGYPAALIKFYDFDYDKLKINSADIDSISTSMSQNPTAYLESGNFPIRTPFLFIIITNLLVFLVLIPVVYKLSGINSKK